MGCIEALLEALEPVLGVVSGRFGPGKGSFHGSEVYCEHAEKGKLKISKGLVNKVLVTGEDGGDCWECLGAEKLKEELNEVDLRFSSQGYKTVGLAVAQNEGPMQFSAPWC